MTDEEIKEEERKRAAEQLKDEKKEETITKKPDKKEKKTVKKESVTPKPGCSEDMCSADQGKPTPDPEDTIPTVGGRSQREAAGKNEIAGLRFWIPLADTCKNFLK